MSQLNKIHALDQQASAFSESTKVNILKGIAVIGLVVVVLDQIYSLFYNSSPYNHLSSLVGYALFGGILYLLKAEKYDLAKDYFCYMGVVAAGVHHYVYGVEIGAEMMYLLIILMSAYVYNSKKSLYVFIASSLLYFVIQVLLINTGEPLGQLHSTEQLKVVIFLLSTITIAFFFRSVFDEEDEFSKVKQEKNEQLSESNEQLRRFNYVVVNDLKTPISNILNTSSVLSSDKDLESEKEKEYAQSIIEGGNQLSEMVQSIRSFQELDKTEFVYEKVQIVDAVEESCRTLRQLMDSNRMTISYEANKNVVTSRYQLFVTFKSLVEHIIAYKQDICMNVHFSFDDSDRDYMRIYLDTVTFGPQFKILPRVADKHYVPFAGTGEYSEETHTDMILIHKMVDQLGGNIYRTDVEAEKAYLIELPKNKQISNVSK